MATLGGWWGLRLGLFASWGCLFFINRETDVNAFWTMWRTSLRWDLPACKCHVSPGSFWSTGQHDAQSPIKQPGKQVDVWAGTFQSWVPSCSQGFARLCGGGPHHLVVCNCVLQTKGLAQAWLLPWVISFLGVVFLCCWVSDSVEWGFLPSSHCLCMVVGGPWKGWWGTEVTGWVRPGTNFPLEEQFSVGETG